MSIFAWGIEKHAFKCTGFDIGSLLNQSLIIYVTALVSRGVPHCSSCITCFGLFILPTCNTLPNGARPLYLLESSSIQ